MSDSFLFYFIAPMFPSIAISGTREEKRHVSGNGYYSALTLTRFFLASLRKVKKKLADISVYRNDVHNPI